MKTATLHSLALGAVVASVILIPVSLAAYGLVLTAAGLLAVMLADYGRKPARYALPKAPVLGLASTRRPKFVAAYAA